MAKLEAQGRRRGETKTRTAERLIEEGLRMEGHPGIVFRDGPSGRRAGLPAGPDVWEVIDTLRNTEERGDEAVAVVAEWAGLSTAQVRAAVRYFGEFPDEVDERIRRHREDADAELAAWERAREALA